MRTKSQVLQRLCAIEVELSDIHYQNQHGSFDMDRNRRRNLSEEHVMLSREYERLEKEEKEG